MKYPSSHQAINTKNMIVFYFEGINPPVMGETSSRGFDSGLVGWQLIVEAQLGKTRVSTLTTHPANPRAKKTWEIE